MNVLILDDETPAIKVLKGFVEKVPFLNLVLATTNPFEAFQAINSNKIDLLFLDIEMPDINGVDFLKSITSKPMVVLTTAYEKYAVQGYELDVLDYLVKPIRFERFMKAVNKASELNNLQANKSLPAESENEDMSGYITLKVEYKTVKVFFKDILYIEGLKDYVKVFTRTERILTRLNLKGIEEKLPSHLFMRVHRSFIVALSKIEAFQKGHVQVDKNMIPVGETFKKEVLEKLNS